MGAKEAGLAAKIQAISKDVLSRHIGRADIVRATWLALLSKRPAFFLGSPGVDKTGTVQEMAKRIEGCRFFDTLMPTVVSVEQLLVESTSIEETPAEGGGRTIRTRDQLGRAADAHIFFADEIWKAEPRVLQTTIDLAKGDGVRHEGQMRRTPLMAFLAASNELPDSEGNLGAIWSRMTIRVVVSPLDRAGKQALAAARLRRDRAPKTEASQAARLTLAEVEELRAARAHVEVPKEIVSIVLDIYEDLTKNSAADFQWLWNDDRRFGRVFDILQANALLDGRTRVTKADLAVLEWLLWDTPEQIATVRAKIAPFCRTPAVDAQELVDALLSPTGVVMAVINGDRAKSVQALTQCESAANELARLKGEAGTDAAMVAAIEQLAQQVAATKQKVVNVTLGITT